jgi:hypothetical protein
MTGFPDWVLNEMPQPLFALAMFSLLALAAVIGKWARGYRTQKPGSLELESTQEGYVVSAVLGLLALLMGFTFSMAVDRYDQRRSLVTEEANAISSTYLMAQTFAEPHRSRISEILVSYVDNRLVLARESDRERVAALFGESQAMQTRLWTAALAATNGLRDDIASNFLDRTTEAIEAGERRVAARQSHIPTRVHVILLVYMFITAGVMGFAFANSPQYVTSGTLFVLLTISMVLIVDLDRPTSGAIVESQRAMENLQARLQAIPPTAFGSGTRAPLELPVR